MQSEIYSIFKLDQDIMCRQFGPKIWWTAVNFQGPCASSRTSHKHAKSLTCQLANMKSQLVKSPTITVNLPYELDRLPQLKIQQFHFAVSELTIVVGNLTRERVDLVWATWHATTVPTTLFLCLYANFCQEWFILMQKSCNFDQF